jgi:hypothetical protein
MTPDGYIDDHDRFLEPYRGPGASGIAARHREAHREALLASIAADMMAMRHAVATSSDVPTDA